MSNDLQTFVNIYNCQINKIYVDKFWNNINNKRWLYIDDEVIEWIGYRKENGKSKYINIVKENFKENIDYKTYTYEQINTIFHYPLGGNENNKEILEHKDKITNIHNRTVHLILSPKCFKKSLMMIRTYKANQIRDYYVDIEELCLEYNKYLLMIKDNELKEISKNHSLMSESMILSYNGKTVLYIARIDTNLIKFGISNKISNRIQTHKSNFEVFELIYITECYNNLEIETSLKDFAKVNNKLTSKLINGSNYTELISIDNEFTIDMILQKIKDECINQYSYNDLQVKHHKLINEKDMLNKAYINIQHHNKQLTDKIITLEQNIKHLETNTNTIKKLENNNKQLNNKIEELSNDLAVFKIANKALILELNNTNDNIKKEVASKEEAKVEISKDNIKNVAKEEATEEDKEEAKECKPKVKKKFTCTKCEKSFVTSMILTRHINLNICKNKDEIIKYICNKCNVEFVCKTSLHRHINNKVYPCDEIKPKKIYTCIKCNKIFEKASVYYQHTHKKTPCDTILQCKKCNHTFTKISNYNSHINSKISCI